jgi:hypothetical protein
MYYLKKLILFKIKGGVNLTKGGIPKNKNSLIKMNWMTKPLGDSGGYIKVLL